MVTIQNVARTLDGGIAAIGFQKSHKRPQFRCVNQTFPPFRTPSAHRAKHFHVFMALERAKTAIFEF